MHFFTEPVDEFPDASEADEDGLVAFGGDLSPETLIKAYRKGIFPWFNEEDPIMWWSPDPRMVLFLEELYISKSLRKVLRDNVFTIKMDTAFQEVIRGCANTRRIDQDGTWITPDMIEAYTVMHRLGYAHSVEAYANDELVGGLYGLAIGKVFFGESMFQKQTNASKVAFVHLVRFLQAHDFKLIDAQQDTMHLRSLGASLLSREAFLQQIENAISFPSLMGNWNEIYVNYSK